MSLQEIKELALNEKSNLFAIIDENNIQHNFIEYLIIFD